MGRSVHQTQKECLANDSPIEANQIWVARANRKIIRRVRVLAQMPVPTGYNNENQRVWILEEKPSPMMSERRLFTCPEFNLRYVFRLHGMYKGEFNG